MKPTVVRNGLSGKKMPPLLMAHSGKEIKRFDQAGSRCRNGISMLIDAGDKALYNTNTNIDHCVKRGEHDAEGWYKGPKFYFARSKGRSGQLV